MNSDPIRELGDSLKRHVSRPGMKEYGIHQDLEGMLPWAFVDEQMTVSRNYWIATSRPDGRPHVAPVWGAWIDEILFFGTANGSLKARNIHSQPNVVAHLESGDEVVIIEGSATLFTSVVSALYERIADQYRSKYDGWAPNPPTVDEPIYAIEPQVVFAWLESDFPRTATRWTLEQGGR